MWIQILQLKQSLLIQIHTHPPPLPPTLYYYFYMNALELQRLLRENETLKAQLRQINTNSHCLNNDLHAQNQLSTRQQHEIDSLKRQIKSLKKKNEEEQIEREQVEHRYLLVLQKLEEELENYKKKYYKLQNKIAPLVDQDTVRLKILNEVEGNHQLEINNLKNHLATLKDQLLKHKRENEVLKHSLQNQRMNREEEKWRAKTQKNNQFAQDTINYLTFSMWKDMEAKLKNSYDQAKKQAEFYKEKYFTAEKKYQNMLLSREHPLSEEER